MTSVITRLYDYLKRHRMTRWLSLAVITAIMALLLSRQSYKEDITDFLPLDSQYQKAMEVYQTVSNADRIVAVFEFKDSTAADPDVMTDIIDRFEQNVNSSAAASMIKDWTSQIDTEQFSDIAAMVYANIPYFLTTADYERFDTLLAKNDYIDSQLEADKQMLQFPVSGLLSENFQKDPLNLFTPVVAQLQQSQPATTIEMYDGYIFSDDMTKAFAMMRSVHGSNESEKNSQLLTLLEQAANDAVSTTPNVTIRFFGGPVIAVENARQIKSDSSLTVIVAVILIVLLLFWVFRSVRNMLLIVISIAWGWLFAMGLLALLHNGVSVIVIGISAIILGIAVNYPLHLIAHLRHTPDRKTALREIVMPLVVGNITTVGAFMALVPLNSAALRDLGLFSAFLLIGTIVFVLVYLPHMAKVGATQNTSLPILDRLGNISPENSRYIVAAVVIITIVLGYFSLKTSFDSNISHINYMTENQKEDMAYFQQMAQLNDDKQSVFVVNSSSSLDSTLIQVERLSPLFASLNDSAMVEDVRTCDRFLSSQQEQIKRLEQWNNFIAKHGKALENEVRRAAASQGFAQDSFNEFYNLLNNHFDVQNADYFEPIVTSVYSTQIIVDTINSEYRAITTLTTTADKIGKVETAIKAQDENALVFDINNVNSTIATNLSDNFNYIGWACALIVFIFLWFSLGSIELALLSFLPMAVSWVWILGIMALLGIKFNVVNVILATFIFGQGDDYTIFMTEGCQYEYAYGRKMLASYKHSIIISALIMFIGIGSLIFAKHPALHSLAQVTIVGMFSVVLMAYLFPPLIFKWLIKRRDNLRQRPVTLRSLFAGNALAATIALQFVTFLLMSFATLKNATKRKAWLRRRMASSLKFDIRHLSPVRFHIDNDYDISSPSTVAYNHESPLDFAFLMSAIPGIVVQHTDYNNKAVRTMLRLMTPAITDDCIMATDVANSQTCDVAVHLHGAALATPPHSIRVYRSEVTATITAAYDFEKIHNDLRQKCEDADFFAPLVADIYRYRGVEIATKVRKLLKKRQNYKPWTAEYGTNPPASVTVVNSGCGELPLLLALICPDTKITAIDSDSDNQALTTQCAHALGCDINVAASAEGIDLNDSTLFLLAPTSDDKARFAALSPIIID